MKSVCSIGECMLELSGAGNDWRMGFAGDTFNTLWAIKACLPDDYSCDFVSAFGDDPFSAQQISFFAEHGIGIGNSPTINGTSPGLYAITLDGAERSFTYWRSAAAARKLADDAGLLATSLEGRKLIYFSGITLAILEPSARRTLIETIGAARKTGSLVAFDPNYRPRLWPSVEDARKATTEALAVSDIALPTFPDEAALFGDASPEATATRLKKAGVGEIIVKNGEEPALISAGGDTRMLAAVMVENPVDTTGAGDSFNGSYLAARLLDDMPIDAARRAHTIAAGVVQVRGALSPMDGMKRAFGS